MRWKQWRMAHDRGEWHLFDIETDKKEEHNLAAEKPELVRDMRNDGKPGTPPWVLWAW